MTVQCGAGVGGVPGVVGDWVGGREGYTGTQSPAIPGPIFKVFLEAKPYPRPNEGFS